MPRIKRVILWEGNPNDLPNRKVKSNVVFSNTNNLGSKLMKCYENDCICWRISALSNN